MIPENCIKHQLAFYSSNKAGCAFAALAARDPVRYGWAHVVVKVDAGIINQAIDDAIGAQSTTMISLLFPEVTNLSALLDLIEVLESCPAIDLEQDQLFEDSRCLGFRASVDTLKSWISGFGPFDFFPRTRQTPHTEITLRVKARPDYPWVMKPAEEGVIHLADLDMQGLPVRTFRKMWNSSLKTTEGLIGHKPDLRSAARTTFAIPLHLLPIT